MRPGTTGSPPINSAAPGDGNHTEAEEQKNTAKFFYPRLHTVKSKVLADLLRGEALTHMDVWERHGSSRAAHHVLRLRQAGWPIQTVEIDAPTSDGRIARIAQYEMLPETIAEAGEAGRAFAAECAEIEREWRPA